MQARLAPRIEMRHIHKRFGAVNVLNGVDLNVQQGEVVGLVGDNGAGKSTLMKVLAGVTRPEQGSILVDGSVAKIRAPRDARTLGIEMVYQDLALCDDLDIAANLYLGREKRHAPTGRLDSRTMRVQAREHLSELHVQIPDITQKARTLSGGQRQAVAIARAATFDPKLLVLDEPTAALAAAEVAVVLELVGKLSARGVGVVLITHRLQDLFAVADRMVVLFEGHISTEFEPAQVSMEQLINAMMGQPV